MSNPIDAPFPPPGTTGTTGSTTPPTPTATLTVETTSTSTSTGTGSTTDVAKEEAKNVGQTAADAGGQVVSTAADQAKQVAQETRRQAQDLLDQGRTQLREQTITQQQKASQGLSSLASEIRGLADGTSQGAPGPARDLLHQGAGLIENLAGTLQTREPAELLDEVRRFARRKPGMFLLGAAAAGVLAGRLTSGMKAVHTDDSSGGRHGISSAGTNYVDPAPSYAGYSETVVEVAGTTPAPPRTSTPLPPPPYGSVPPAGSVVPPTTPAGWDDPAQRPGGVV